MKGVLKEVAVEVGEGDGCDVLVDAEEGGQCRDVGLMGKILEDGLETL